MEFSIITGEKNLNTTKRIRSYVMTKSDTGYILSINNSKNIKKKYLNFKDLNGSNRLVNAIYEINDNIPIDITINKISTVFGKISEKIEIPLRISKDVNDIILTDEDETIEFVGKGKLLAKLPKGFTCEIIKSKDMNEKINKVLIW